MKAVTPNVEQEPDMASLARQKCLITGAASGIGRATAVAAARAGAQVILTDINATPLQAVADLIWTGVPWISPITAPCRITRTTCTPASAVWTS
jgi:NAD(P)-dependent dehydrogenase (short-subunit alcohol dehydrogenase family)